MAEKNPLEKLEMENGMLRDVALAYALLQSDRPPERAGAIDVAYLHGLSKGMMESGDIFTLVANLAQKWGCKIAFNGSDGEGMPPQDKPGMAWPGKKYFMESLSFLKVPTAMMRPTRPGLHTRDEADAFVELAKQNNWKSAGVFSVGYHSVRSMSCMIAAMEKNNYFFSAHFVVPPRTNAWFPMKGSQSIKDTDTFTEVGEKEIPSILKYWERGGENPPYSWRKGWAVPARFLFHYLEYREIIVSEQRFPAHSL